MIFDLTNIDILIYIYRYYNSDHNSQERDVSYTILSINKKYLKYILSITKQI